MNFTQADLDKMGMKKNPDGSYSKEKTVLQPREKIFIPNHEIQKTDYTPEMFASAKPLGAETWDGSKWVKQQPKKKPKKKQEEVYFKHQDIQDVYAQMEQVNSIFIPRNVPSSKNSKRAYKNIVLESKLCVQYRKDTDIHWRIFKPRFLELIRGKEKPYKIEFFFVRGNRHKADFHNLVQLPMDIMQEYLWIDGDDMDECVPVPRLEGKPYGYDKKLPGMIIKVL